MGNETFIGMSLLTFTCSFGTCAYRRVWMGVPEYQLSAKFLPKYQLSAKNFAKYQLSVKIHDYQLT